MPDLNDLFNALGKIKKHIEKLRKREAGVVETEGAGFPYSVNLSRFRSTDEVVVVASGWFDDGSLHPIFVHTTVEWDGSNHVLTLQPYKDDGQRVSAGEFVHISWIAMV